MGGAKRGLAALAALAFWAPALAADDIPARLDAARNAYQKGDMPKAAREVEAVLTQLHQRLGRSLADTMPPGLAGWQADSPEIQGLGQVGGGLAVTRGYTKGDATLNASLIIDSPAVEAAAALMSNPAATAAQPNMKRIKLGGEEALLRFDSATKAGEVTMVLGNRVLLEIEGDNLANGDMLTETAKGWNVARIRQLTGI